MRYQNHADSQVIARRFAAALVALLLLTLDVGGARNPEAVQIPPFAALDAARVQGNITQSDAALLKLEFLINEAALPSAYRVDHPGALRCGFPVVAEVLRAQPEFTQSQQSLATALQARPAQDTSFVSASGFFRLHYDTSGVEAVPMADDNLNGAPDFIESAAAYLDSSWDYYHTTLGYALPPTDGGAGGDDKYDVYFVALGGYGATIFDGPGPAAWDDFKSYILLHRTFLGFPPNNDPEGSQLGALKATIAHEYFHAVQLAYDGTDDLWLHESTATYKENRVFPETDDNFQFLQYYYNDPDTFLTASSGNKQYGSFVWPEYVTVTHGDSIMRQLWEELRFQDGVTTYDDVLAPLGTTVAKEFQEFTLWNFFTGDRFAPGYFTDGASYPGIVFDGPLPTPPFAGVTGVKPPDGLATNYRSLALSGAPGGLLMLDFDGADNVSWGLNLIFRDTLGDYEVIELSVPLSGIKSFTRYDYNKWDTLFVAAAVTSPWLNNNSYTLTATVLPHGDADGSGAVNIADATYLLAYTFSSGPEPPYDPLLGDADCSGRLNISDVTYLIATIFSGGPLPCAGE